MKAATICLGALAWGALELSRQVGDDLAAIERLLAGLLLLVAPVLLRLSQARTPAGVVLLAGCLASASWHVEAGALAALAAASWLLVGCVELVEAGRRWWPTPGDPVSGTRAVGRLFLAVGGGWLVFARAGGSLPGLSAETVRLAAVHSHATGFGALTLIALAARSASRPVGHGLAACGVVLGLGFACTGIGIASAHALEPLGALLLALALGGYAGLALAQRPPTRGGKAWRGVSLLGLSAALGLGLARASRHLGGAEPLVDRAGMIALHGIAALVFLLAGALAEGARSEV